MKKDIRDNREYFDFQEEQDEYAMSAYGVRIKNRAGNKNKKPKFSARNEKEDYAD